MSIVKLSIIIPTKNRYSYLFHCLKWIIDSYKGKNIEIIIHDNSTEIAPREFNVLLTNKQVKYYKTDSWLSAVDNFERAIASAEGEYLTMIGDDDALSPHLIEVTEWMERAECDALTATFATYLWPDIKPRNRLISSGTLTFPPYDCSLTRIDAKAEILNCLASGGTTLSILPRMYYGIIKSSVMQEVKENSGFFLPGSSPDMANAVSSALYVKNLYACDFPLFIAGNSFKSTAGMGAAGNHVGNIETTPFLPKRCAVEWPALIPKFWSGPTIWAESATKALLFCGCEYLLEKFNFPYLYAKCFVFHPDRKLEIRLTVERYIKGKALNSTLVWSKIRYCMLVVWMLRLKMLLKNIKKKFGNREQILNDIEDVYSAAALMEKVTKKDLPFKHNKENDQLHS